MKFFDSRRGRRGSFWHIDQENIWRVSSISGVFLEIFEFGDFDAFSEDFDYIGIQTLDNKYYVRKVITIQELANTFRITVDEAWPSLDPSEIWRISRARLSRFVKDTLQENWHTSEYVEIPTEIQEILAESDVEMS